MESLFEELNTDYSRNSTGPVERDEIMGFAEMIKSLIEYSDFLLAKENKNNVQKIMMQLFKELRTDYSVDSKVERYDSGSGELNAYGGVLAKTRCAKRGLGTQSERVKRIPSSPANADGSDALDAVHVAQKTIQELHIGKEPDRPTNPDEAVASGAVVQAAASTSQDLAKKSSCRTPDDDGQARGGEHGRRQVQCA